MVLYTYIYIEISSKRIIFFHTEGEAKKILFITPIAKSELEKSN